jgi:hypothetical protein
MRIETRFAIVPKTIGRYHAFPTLAMDGKDLWMAYRSGLCDVGKVHGGNGSVCLIHSTIDHPMKWKDQGTLFSQEKDGSVNELDAILSIPSPGEFFLATRDYYQPRCSRVYLSKGSHPHLNTRTAIEEVAEIHAICFGHIRKTTTGELLMPGYSGLPGEKGVSAVLQHSKDQGDTWQLRSFPVRSGQSGVWWTEFSLICVGKAHWTALIRNETPPFPLHRMESMDDGKSWSEPCPVPLFGHAPMMIQDALGRLLVLYRETSDEKNGIGIGVSLDHGGSWAPIGTLTTYSGSRYNGGYGDLVEITPNRFLAAYYLSDADESPWIEGCVFSIDEGLNGR